MTELNGYILQGILLLLSLYALIGACIIIAILYMFRDRTAFPCQVFEAVCRLAFRILDAVIDRMAVTILGPGRTVSRRKLKQMLK